MKQLDDWMAGGRIGDVFIVSRYLYRIGEPVIEDRVYDSLEQFLQKKHYVDYREYLERSYDEDPVPEMLLEELGIQCAAEAQCTGLYQYLEEEKSKSIRAVRDWEQVYDFMQMNRGKVFVASLKVDGVNAKHLYKDGVLSVSLSRGRKGNSIDYSTGAKFVLPGRVQAEGLLKVTGECFVEPEKLPYLREKYGQDKYKTAKSAAISMLRVKHDELDYQFLKFLAFHADGDFATVSEMCRFLEGHGFETPPRLRIRQWPVEKGQFKEWLFHCVLHTLEVNSMHLPSDGVVLEVDDLVTPFQESHQYSERQMAMKFGHWDFGYEKGVITDIKIEQRRVYKSVRIAIEPMQTKDGCKAEFVNSYNPSILIKNDLYCGKTVYFEKNSDAVIVLIHGDRLKRIMAMEEGMNAEKDWK